MDQALTNDDLRTIQNILTEMVSDSLLKKKTDMIGFTAVVEIPEPVVRVFELIADRYGQEVQDIVDKAASHNIHEWLNTIIKQPSKQKTQTDQNSSLESLKEMGIDTSRIDELMDSFKGIVDKFNSLAQTMNNTDNDTPDLSNLFKTKKDR